MPWIFKRRVRILPGLTLNLGKRGVSMSVGRRGMHYTTGTSGNRFTVGIPGTGLYNTTRLTDVHRTAVRRRSPPIGLDRIHLPGTGFWAFLVPGPSIKQLVETISSHRAEIWALDQIAERATRLEQSDVMFVTLWNSARMDFGAVLHARPRSKAAIDALIEAYRALLKDLAASVKHVGDQEHDAHLNQRGTHTLQATADALVQTLHAADDLMKRLLDPGQDAQVLERDMRYTIESLQTRYGIFAQAMHDSDSTYVAANPTRTFDF